MEMDDERADFNCRDLHRQTGEPSMMALLKGGHVLTGLLARCLQDSILLTPKEIAAFSCASLDCQARAEAAAVAVLHGSHGVIDRAFWQVSMRAPASIVVAAAWAAHRLYMPSCVLFISMVSGLGWKWLPQLLAREAGVKESSPWHDAIACKDLASNATYQESLLRATRFLAGYLPQHSGSIMYKSFWQVVSEMHHCRPDPPVGIQTPVDHRSAAREVRYWFFTDRELQAEMARQGAGAVDLLFCLRWHLYQQDDDLSQPLERLHYSWQPPRAPHSKWIPCRRLWDGGAPPRVIEPVVTSVAGICASTFFLLMAHLNYLAEDDGSATVFEAVLGRISDPSFQKPCLLALELMRHGELHGDPFEVPAGPQTEEQRFLIRVAALLPVRLHDNSTTHVANDGVQCMRGFGAVAKAVAHAIQLMVESSLSFVLMNLWDSTSGELECDLSKSVDAGFTFSPGLLVSSLMSYELPRSGAAALMACFLEYSGEPELFSSELTRRFCQCECPLDDLLRAFRLWEEVCACIERFPDLAQQDAIEEMQGHMQGATLLLKGRRELLGI